MKATTGSLKGVLTILPLFAVHSILRQVRENNQAKLKGTRPDSLLPPLADAWRRKQTVVPSVQAVS